MVMRNYLARIGFETPIANALPIGRCVFVDEWAFPDLFEVRR
jgi:hypothetical protein